MPTVMYIAAEGELDSSGIDITWTPTAQRLEIGGWYDSFVGIESEAMSLREFFDQLGITEEHCKKAWRE